ncbi:hypothetical protein C8J56DRAFT_1068951 [Mycena floridula]|nr:hypothetical protein C8J56DRAFT_1068951 [Mycena floridula]
MAEKLGRYTSTFYIHDAVPICNAIRCIIQNMPQLEILYLAHCKLHPVTTALQMSSVRALAVDIGLGGFNMLQWALKGCQNIVVLHVLADDQGSCDDWSWSNRLQDDMSRYRDPNITGLRCYRLSRPANAFFQVNRRVRSVINLKKVQRMSIFVDGFSSNHFTYFNDHLDFLEIKLGVDNTGTMIPSHFEYLSSVKELFVHVEAQNIHCLNAMLRKASQPWRLVTLNIAVYGDPDDDRYLGNIAPWKALDVEIARGQGASRGLLCLNLYPCKAYCGSGTTQDLPRAQMAKVVDDLSAAFQLSAFALSNGGFPTFPSADNWLEQQISAMRLT